MNFTLLFFVPQGWELLLILFVILLLFGGSRLPQLARGMGKSIREFKKGVGEGGEEDADKLDAAPRRESLRATEAERAREDELAADRAHANKSR